VPEKLNQLLSTHFKTLTSQINEIGMNEMRVC